MSDDMSTINSFHFAKRTYDHNIEMDKNHYHHHYEILYIYENSRTLVIGDNEYILNKNNVALIPPFIPHLTLSGAEVPQKRILINFRLDLINNINNILNCDISKCFNTLSPVISIEEFSVQFKYLITELEKNYTKIDNKYNRDLIKLQLGELLLLLSSKNESTSNDNASYNIVKYIENHFSETISLDQLAKEFYMSKYTISRKFKTITGLSIPKYVSTIRIIHAKRLIEEGMNFSNVSLNCGFNSLNDFERVFKTETGTTPRDYKRLLNETPIKDIRIM